MLGEKIMYDVFRGVWNYLFDQVSQSKNSIFERGLIPFHSSTAMSVAYLNLSMEGAVVVKKKIISA